MTECVISPWSAAARHFLFNNLKPASPPSRGASSPEHLPSPSYQNNPSFERSSDWHFGGTLSPLEDTKGTRWNIIFPLCGKVLMRSSCHRPARRRQEIPWSQPFLVRAQLWKLSIKEDVPGPCSEQRRGRQDRKLPTRKWQAVGGAYPRAGRVGSERECQTHVTVRAGEDSGGLWGGVWAGWQSQELHCGEGCAARWATCPRLWEGPQRRRGGRDGCWALEEQNEVTGSCFSFLELVNESFANLRKRDLKSKRERVTSHLLWAELCLPKIHALKPEPPTWLYLERKPLRK